MTPRERRILAIYGVTPEQYERLFEFQGGACAICFRPLEEGKVVVDHDHVERRVRGLLCRRCNHKVLGHHRVGAAGIELLRHAAMFLEFPPAEDVGIGPMPVKRRPKRRKRAVTLRTAA